MQQEIQTKKLMQARDSVPVRAKVDGGSRNCLPKKKELWVEQILAKYV